jgi:hypothetical protein
LDQITRTAPRTIETPQGCLVTSREEINRATGQHRLIVELETAKAPILDLEDTNRGRNWDIN